MRGADAVASDELARQARAGSKPAFETLVGRFEGPLFRFLLLRLGHRELAEELTQETFLRAWRKLDLYDPGRRFSTWLFTLARRLAVSQARRPEPPRAIGDLTSDAGEDGREISCSEAAGMDPSEMAAQREEGILVWKLAAEVLKVEQRSALWLRYAEGLSSEEISGILGRPATTVRVLLFRAREALAAHLEGEPAVPTKPPLAGKQRLAHNGHVGKGAP